MSDLTNTPTPAYGKAARRFNAEQALGRRVVEILRGDDPCHCDMTPRLEGTAAPKCLACKLDDAARSLDLLPRERGGGA